MCLKGRVFARDGIDSALTPSHIYKNLQGKGRYLGGEIAPYLVDVSVIRMQTRSQHFIGIVAADHGKREAITLLASGNASVSAIAAQFVAALEIHWSCSCGKPASKEGWKARARVCTHHEPSCCW
jgi:hypothetical protein